MIDVVELTHQLIRIPSFVAKDANESDKAAFLFELMSKDPRLSVTKQQVAEGRFNVVATTPGLPSLLLAGHMDTVPPCSGWTVDPFAGQIHEEKLYGLGAVDMLGGLAAIVAAVLNSAEIPSGLTVLLYCDEEYDFEGMKTFIEQQVWEKPPKLGVVGEPTSLGIWNSHRGIVELDIVVAGRSAHASRPDEGINAVEVVVDACREVTSRLGDDPDPVLGVSSLNMAGLRGGMLGPDGQVVIQPNAVPDRAEAIIDIRTSTSAYTAEKLSKLLTEAIERAGGTLTELRVNHSLGSLNTATESLGSLVEAVASLGREVNFLDGKNKGYGDGQMLAERFGIPVANFGPSGEGMHGPDEYVDIGSLRDSEHVYRQLITNFT